MAAVRTTVGLLRTPLEALVEGHARYGDRFDVQIGPLGLSSILEPDSIHHVLVRNAKNYRKSPSYRALAMVLGQGLVTSDGELWKRQRRLSQPAFHHRAIADLAATMSDCTADLDREWSHRAADARVDVHAEMMGLTMRIVGRALFGAELAADRDRVYDALGIALAKANSSLESLTLMPTWLPTADNRRFRRAMKELDALVYRIIDQRRASPPRPDLLGLLMEARDDDGGPGMSDVQLRDEVMTLFVAGHETVANALTWAWVCIGENPDVERRLVEETSRVLGGRMPTGEDVPRLPYTSQVIDEVMRLYPPAWIIERQAIDADDLPRGQGPRHLRPGTLVTVCTYLLHRHPRWWSNPDRFDPDRFDPNRSRDRHRYAYIPFGAGPRICIGNAFAKMEAVIALAGLVQHWHVALREQPPGLDPGITLRPAGGLPARLVVR